VSSPLLVPGRGTPLEDGLLARVTPESAGWKYVGFEVYRLASGMTLKRKLDGHEACLVMLSGRADVSFGSLEWPGVGGRASVFDGTPDVVYVPPGGTLEVVPAGGDCEVALCSAPARSGATAVLLPAAGVKPFQRGSGHTGRTIHNLLMEDEPAESLLVTEVLTPAGNWSSFPPHKHDTDDLPRETYLEETYYHRTAKPDGFAVQLVYTDDRATDEAIQVRDGDVVLVPRGYHPVSAAPGYDLYYLNVMAGPRRRWMVTTDPDHRWMLEAAK
jgi:5-deoxy-glucuronate isomerase